jgi:catechol 2,3-dioxygenase-like lactoylglutathione lyase family enzyme
MLRPKALDHVGLVIADLDRGLRFYVKGLGLELLRRRERTDGESSAGSRSGDGNIVTISRLPSVTGSNKPPGWNRWSPA